MDDARTQMARLIMTSPIGRQATQQVATAPNRGGGGGGVPALSADRILEELGSELNDLWEASKPHVTNIPVDQRKIMAGGNPITRKNEQGCWILYNKKDGALRAAPFTAPSTRDGCVPGKPPLQKNERVAAFFHTHPNTGEEGYDKGPSPADLNFATSKNFPGLVRTQIGGYTWFGPPVA